MATLNISLPDTMRGFVESQLTEGGYSTVSEYIRELLRAEQKRKAEMRLENLLLEGLNSGEPEAYTREWLDEARQEVRARILARKQN